MTKFVKKQQGKDGTRYAILRERADFAVCRQDAYTWRYIKRHLSMDAAENLLAAYAL